MTEKEAVEILKDMNDGYTFQDCRVCVSDNKFNEKKGICESKTCEYLNAIDTVIQALEQKDKEIQELKKYDIRNIKIDKDKIISSPSFTRKEVDLMNLGIALSLNADKLFNDESEEDDI